MEAPWIKPFVLYYTVVITNGDGFTVVVVLPFTVGDPPLPDADVGKGHDVPPFEKDPPILSY